MRRLLVLLVRAYQIFLSPFLGGNCRFYPSCSAYACECLEVHGAVRGSWLAVRRIARCHPLGSAGVDLVPRLWASPIAAAKTACHSDQPRSVFARPSGAREKSS